MKNVEDKMFGDGIKHRLFAFRRRGRVMRCTLSNKKCSETDTFCLCRFANALPVKDLVNGMVVEKNDIVISIMGFKV